MPATIIRQMLDRKWGWANPKIDLVSPVLYAPLWRPDMVARGGRIVNGTGICTGSPLHLTVGANTVDVTQAGTLIVYMPEGGTVASGTMTVTGSPVTVSAGIATTITTTGATGNITVTPSNIIRSRDVNRYALTITGGVWGKYGWTADGDDLIKNSTANWRSGDTAGSISAWFKTSSLTTQILFSSCDEATASWQFNFAVDVYTGVDYIEALSAINGVAYGVRGGTSVGDGNWHFATMTGNGTAWTLMLDGATESLTVTFTSNSGDWLADVSNRDNFSIGARIRSTTISYMNGTIGEVLYHSREITLAEHNQLRLATKWRYNS